MTVSYSRSREPHQLAHVVRMRVFKRTMEPISVKVATTRYQLLIDENDLATETSERIPAEGKATNQRSLCLIVPY